MAQASRDQNRVTTLLAVSSADGTTPVVLWADPVTHRLLVDIASGGGTVTSVSVVTANGISGSVSNPTTTPAITLTLGNITPTGVNVSGLTASQLVATDGSKNLQTLTTVTYPSLTEISYVKGVTSAIQTQLDAKVSTGAITSSGLTMTTARLLGRTTASTGAIEEITVGSGLSLSAGVLSATGSGSIGGTIADTQVAYGAGADTIGGEAAFTYNASTNTLTVPNSIIDVVQASGSSGVALKNSGGTTVLTVGPANGTGSTFVGAVNFGGSISPSTNDVGALGSATNSWADLFLASGALLNFANGNSVITHSSAVLEVTTGDFRVTTAGTNSASVVTVGGTQTLTNKTLTSPTLATPSAFTTGGTITLAENTSIALDPAGSADGKYTGITVTATAGYTQAFGDLVYLDPTDSRWEAADANSAAGADGDSRGMLGMVVVAGTDGAACTILLQGIIRADAKFPTFTVNNPIYVSETAGSVTQTQPTTTDAVIRIIGAALTADEMYFSPDNTWITHT